MVSRIFSILYLLVADVISYWTELSSVGSLEMFANEKPMDVGDSRSYENGDTMYQNCIQKKYVRMQNQFNETIAIG